MDNQNLTYLNQVNLVDSYYVISVAMFWLGCPELFMATGPGQRT